MTERSFPQRRSPRLQGYDYSQAGIYFVTICTYQRQTIFGTITEGAMHLSGAGEIAMQRWMALPEHHPGVELDGFVVMPNHVHGLVIMTDPERRDDARIVRTSDKVNTDKAVPDKAGLVPTLGMVIGSYKSGVTRRVRELMRDDDTKVWQDRYHDHIVRDERGLNAIRQYIDNNAALWQEDTFFTGP